MLLLPPACGRSAKQKEARRKKECQEKANWSRWEWLLDAISPVALPSESAADDAMAVLEEEDDDVDVEAIRRQLKEQQAVTVIDRDTAAPADSGRDLDRDTSADRGAAGLQQARALLPSQQQSKSPFLSSDPSAASSAHEKLALALPVVSLSAAAAVDRNEARVAEVREVESSSRESKALASPRKRSSLMTLSPFAKEKGFCAFSLFRSYHSFRSMGSLCVSFPLFDHICIIHSVVYIWGHYYVLSADVSWNCVQYRCLFASPYHLGKLVWMCW